MRRGTLQSTDQFTALIYNTSKRRISISDMEIRGLQLEKYPSGAASWRLRLISPADKRRICITLGDARCLNLTDARNLAMAAKRSFYLGQEPAPERRAKSAPTFEKFVSEQYIPHAKSYKKAWASDISLINKHLLPVLGKKVVSSITREDIAEIHLRILNSGAARGTANRIIAIARHIFNTALRWEVPELKNNPTKDIKLKGEQKLERYLSEQETKRLQKALLSSDNKMLRFIIPMLIFTGARKREVLDARWEDFNFDRRVWRIPKTKSGVARYVPIADGTLALLQSMPKLASCEFVFANPETKQPYRNIFTAWKVIRERAGLEDLRIHDLRHSFASFMVNNGRSLYEVQKLLGHSQISTTERYAHLSQETLMGAANTVSAVIGPSLGYLMETPESSG